MNAHDTRPAESGYDDEGSVDRDTGSVGYKTWLTRAPAGVTLEEVAEAIQEYDSPDQAWPDDQESGR